MRIAVVSYHTCPFEEFGKGFSGGMNDFLREASIRLSLSGDEVVVFTRDLCGLGRVVKNDSFVVRHVECGLPENPDLSDYRERLEEFTTAVLELGDLDFDVVFSNYWLSIVPAVKLSKAAGVPLVHMHHTLEAVKEKYSGSRYDDPRLRHARLFLEFHVHREADCLLHPSEEDADVSVSCYPWADLPRDIVHPGIDDVFFDLPDLRGRGRELLGASSGEIVLLYSGRDERVKNLPGLLEAHAALRDKYGLKLVVLGGEVEDCLEGVRGIPPAYEEELVAVLDGADAVVVPSFYESFSMFGFQALARGKPVLAPERTHLGNFVSRYRLGEVFSPFKGDLREALERLVLNLDFYSLRGIEGRALCERYDWERTLVELKRVFCRVALR